MMPEAVDSTFSVPKEFDRVRADRAVHAQCPEMSRSMIQRLFAAGRVWRDNSALVKSDKVRVGDVLTYSVPPPKPLELEPVDIPLDVLFEDNEIVVINKPSGMVVHPGSGTGGDTLVHALLHHCSGTLSGIGGVERPGIVHRLDKETSGVMVAAKSDHAYAHLSGLFASRSIGKTYFALTDGVPAQASGVIDQPIGRHRTHRVKMAVVPTGRPAVSEWKKTDLIGENRALLEVTILTGRTHQIRVHLAYIGCPVAGDKLYGRKSVSEDSAAIPRCMLHAQRLKLTHPVDQCELEFEAPLPSDFRAALCG